MKNFIYIAIILSIVFFSSCKHSNCNNGIKDGNETAIDCGGTCPECPPTVITTPPGGITYNSAYCGMTYNGTSKESQTFSAFGVCYGTSHNPTTSGYQIGNSGTFNSYGTFNGQITGLTTNTIYYVRGYATDNLATAYGSEMSFTTAGNPVTVTTTSVSSITSTSVSCGGTVTDIGIAPILARGVCWSTNQNPTIADSKTSNGSGTGTFTSNITGLSLGNTYYARAYATNSDGTTYGNQITFTLFYIGQSYGGGIIFYIDNTNQHGLISAPTDQTGSLYWCLYTTDLNGADGTILGTGYQNTIDIKSGCPNGQAAYVCYNSTLGGYNDWYLPSKDELLLLYQKKSIVGGFSTASYWSSSEFDANSAWEVYFFNGNPSTLNKGVSSVYVRPIRSF